MIQILTIRDYNDIEYPLLATKVHTSELNGQDDLELRIPQQKNNNLDLLSIDKLWEFDYNNITYKAVNIKRQTRGHSFNLNVRATPLFYWEFSKSIIHDNHDGSHTANSAFRTVFDGTGFNFVLVDFSPAVTIEGFGKGANRLELFKRLLNRYNYEFIIQGRTVYMHHRIGNDTNFMYKYKLNASNVSENIDASGMFTYIRGFGDFEEGEEDYFNNAGLQDDYLSPLAEIVTKPGHPPDEGPPIVDGRITNIETLQEAMKKAVEDSLAVTIEGTLHDVRKIYDIAVPVKGDRVWLHDERINLEQEIRLHKIVTTYDEKDNIIACDVTFGSQSIGERHKANINSLSKNFRDLLTGKLKLPIISLEQIGMDMINAIHAASSEITFGDFGMMAISKTNPNHVFGVNSEGWYISQDGGATPKTIATAQGIYADALFAGTLWLTNDLNIEGQTGYLNITGERFVMRSKTDPNKYFEITPDGALASHGFLSLTRPDYYVDSNGKEYGKWVQDGMSNDEIHVQRNEFMTSPAISRGPQRYHADTDEMQVNDFYSVETTYTKHDRKVLTYGVGISSHSKSVSGVGNVTARFEIVDINTNEVLGSFQRYINGGQDVVWETLRIDIGVPDFETRKAFLVRIAKTTNTGNTFINLIINRVALDG